MQVPQVPRPKREYHELFMLMSQVYDKLKAKGLLKPLDLRPIPNPLPSRLNVNKRCVYHQGLSHETDSFPVESVEFVKNCFPFNMISNSAYLLDLNVFISEMGKETLNNKELKHGYLEPIKEETQPINLGTDDEPKMIQVVNTLTALEKDALVALLIEFKEIFAYEDMLGIDTDIVQHCIPTDPTMKSIK